MKVHIVCKDDRHVVPRMMRWLADGLGWTMGGHIDPEATVNYYAPYTMLAQYGLAPTLTAAWFTHFESATAGKVDAWNQAARLLDGRFITSPTYENTLATYGRVTRVTPGIDRQHFDIQKSKRRKGLVGLSGIGSARKGLVEAAVLSETYGPRLHVAGRDWGIEGEEWIDYADMPAFYNSIDVYACVATQEGIPAPALEALACGCKLVMGRGVGIANLLADLPGVYLYDPGYIDLLVEAIDTAVSSTVTRSEIREASGEYTIEAWQQSHLEAMTQLIEGAS